MITAAPLSHSAAAFWRRGADVPHPPSTGRRTDSSSLTLCGNLPDDRAAGGVP